LSLDDIHDLDARMLVVEGDIKRHDAELIRHRDKLHELGSLDKAIQLLSNELSHLHSDLTAGLNTLRNEMTLFTEEKIRSAVEAAFEKHTDQSSKAWDTRTKILMVLIALGGWLTAAVQWPVQDTPSAPPAITVTVPSQQGAAP
jgi:hypothetical protein